MVVASANPPCGVSIGEGGGGPLSRSAFTCSAGDRRARDLALPVGAADSGIARHRVAVDLDLDGIGGGPREPFDHHPVVRQQAEVALARMSTDPLDGLLDSREETEARV